MLEGRVIVANWKATPQTLVEARERFAVMKKDLARLRHLSVILAPPSIYLNELAGSYGGRKIAFCVQDFSTSEDSAQTGQTLATQGAAAGASYALVGHSETTTPERKADDLRIKTFLALKHGMTPIVFVGEYERDARGAYLKEVKVQVLSALSELSEKQLSKVIFCYEPVSAIGATEALDSYDVHTMALYIRKVVTEQYSARIAERMRIFYGGAVSERNVVDLFNTGGIDGVVLGRASQDTKTFSSFLKTANTVA